MDKQTYDRIYDSVLFSFEEYIEEDGLSTTQTSAKILEEDNKQLNLSKLSQNMYIVFIANECFERKEIPDFIHSRLVSIVDSEIYTELESSLNKDFKEHLKKCKMLIKNDEFNIVETTYATKMRIDYIFSLKA